MPISRLRRENHQLDWIDDCDSTTVDSALCFWLAEYYNTPPPETEELVGRDLDAGIFLYRWNRSLAIAMTGGDFDAFEGMIGGDSPIERVVCCETWMTQRHAWHLWEFFRASIRDSSVIAELRVR